jgi:hypothetical protein
VGGRLGTVSHTQGRPFSLGPRQPLPLAPQGFELIPSPFDLGVQPIEFSPAAEKPHRVLRHLVPDQRQLVVYPALNPTRPASPPPHRVLPAARGLPCVPLYPNPRTGIPACRYSLPAGSGPAGVGGKDRRERPIEATGGQESERRAGSLSGSPLPYSRSGGGSRLSALRLIWCWKDRP